VARSPRLADGGTWTVDGTATAIKPGAGYTGAIVLTPA
jgi:hypothetical protein